MTESVGPVPFYAEYLICRPVRTDRQTDAQTDELIWGGLGNLRFLDEGMKEVLVYSRTNADNPSPRGPRESSERVEVDLVGSHSRLALGTGSPLRVPPG